jgi:hypothetical protein
MMSERLAADRSPAARGAGPLTWRVHLARRQPGRAVGAVAAALAAGAWAYLLFGSLLAALATTGLLVAAVGEFLFPIRYRIGPEGAEARNLFAWRRIAWRDVRRVYWGGETIKLSPLPHGGPREAFRGVLLRCEEISRDTVVAAVTTYAGPLPGCDGETPPRSTSSSDA